MTHKISERTVIERVRDLMPRRRLTLSEAYKVAELQAAELLRLLDISTAPVKFDKLFALPNVELKMEANYRMDHFSGLSRFSKGRWLIIVDGNDPHGRRRFTMAHEFKHVIDHSIGKIAYAGLGYGNKERQHQHIEAICQHFAACFLMPKSWVRDWWTRGFQDVYALAGHFQVSLTAMEVQLKKFGFIGSEPDRSAATYFRSVSMPRLTDVTSSYPCAA